MPSKHVELVSVYDIAKKVNDAVGREFGVMATDNIPKLLASGIEAVYVASPVNVHREHVAACAAAGKHVLCEKPLGLNVAEAQTMLDACDECGVTLGTAFMMRFSAQHVFAKSLISAGKIGKPVYGRAQLSCWYPPLPHAWRQDPAQGGGGSLVDLGSHCIDLMEMFFGNVVKVSCFINNNVHDYPSEDSAVVSLCFENGAMATIDSYFCIPDNSSRNTLELYGSGGSILASGTIGQDPAGKMAAYLENDQGEYDARQARQDGQCVPIDPPPVNTYRAGIEEFSRALREKRAPLNSSAIGMRNMKIIAACYDSARTGQTMEICH